ncbi:MAG: TIGR04133 family radical SAM/SPASM protein [Prevotella sp.]|nr:TIGR04133 family radical SAM/SPASM protein [Prevotella sp.]
MINELSNADLFRLEIGRKKNALRKKRHTLQQLFWECTLRCNLHCQHCGSDCKIDELAKDMPLNDFLPVLDEVAKFALPRRVLVITTGGEPLVRSDIAECGREITRRGFMWGMVSNGLLLTEEKLDQLIGAGLRTIAISLDGFEDAHNWMRGNEHSFEKAVNAIKALTRRFITWDVITCVNQRNYDSLNDFKDFLISIGVRQWRIFTVFPGGRAKNNADLQLSSEQTRQLMDFIVKTREEGRIALSFSCEGFLGYYEHRVRDYQFFCQAGINVASILSDGSISGCLSIRSDYNQGNIYRDSFAEIWNRRFEKYRNREWMRNGDCADCKFWHYCEGNGMHLRDSNGELLRCNLLHIQGEK